LRCGQLRETASVNAGGIFSNVHAGYCSSCGKPSKVGDLALPGWAFVYQLCDLCLAEFQKAFANYKAPE